MQREKVKILYVDDEDSWRSTFQRDMSEVYEVITARNAEEGWELLNRHAREIAVLISDQRMPGRPGIELLKQARAYYPKIVRIIATGLSEGNLSVHATNLGSLYHHIGKPWNTDELNAIVKRAVDVYQLRRERDHLLERKLSTIMRKNLESKLQCLLVFGVAHKESIHRAMDAFSTYLQGITVDPGQLSDYRTVFRQAQSELNCLLSNLGIAQSLYDLPDQLRAVGSDSAVDVRRVLLGARDSCNQVIYSVRSAPAGRPEQRSAAEQLLVERLLELIQCWVGDQRDQKLLEISEPVQGCSESSGQGVMFHLRICDYRDPDPLPEDHDDPRFNGINLDESRELAWVRFLLSTYHFGGSIQVVHLSRSRLQILMRQFDPQAKQEMTPSGLASDLILKFETWNHAPKPDQPIKSDV